MTNWDNVVMYAVCALTCAINLWTLHRAQRVEDAIKARLKSSPWLDESKGPRNG